MSSPSQLFLARIWKEPRSRGGNAVRVQVRHVLSGETRYFTRWRDVVCFLLEQMEEEEGDEGRSESDDCGGDAAVLLDPL